MPQTKKKLLIINSTLEKSGLTNVFFNLCSNINTEIFDVYILTLSPEPPNSKKTEFEQLPIKIHSLNLNRIDFIIKGKKQLIDYVNSIAPDIIQTFSFRGTYLAGKYLNKYNLVATVQGDLMKNHTDVYGNIVGKYIAEKELAAFGKANEKVVCSKALFEIYKNKFTDLKVIKNGADENIFYPVIESLKLEIRKKLGLNPDLLTFLSVGTLSERKDPITIIKAFKNSNKHSKAQLVFLGDGVLKDACIQEAKGFNIIFLGNKDDVANYYKAADAFISASSSEGLPNTVLEAGMCGLFCMLSNIPQHTEIFKNHPWQSFYFDCSNITQLTTLFNQFTPREFESIIDLSALKMTKQYEQVYLNIVE
jgi:glycosyltransferase involved in cell wall biosynthesis